MQNLLLGVGIGLVGTLAVLTARYVAAVLAGRAFASRSQTIEPVAAHLIMMRTGEGLPL
jgi:hypothetical protein